MLPGVVKVDLARHLETVRAQHQDDLTGGAGWVELQTALLRKYPGVGLAVGLSCHAALPGSGHGPATAPSPARDRPSAGCQGRRPPGGAGEARQPAHAPALVRDAPPGGRPRHPHRTGAPRAPGRQHDDDLHARAEPRARCGAEPGRPDVQPVTGLAARTPDRCRICHWLVPPNWAGAGGFARGQSPGTRAREATGRGKLRVGIDCRNWQVYRDTQISLSSGRILVMQTAVNRIDPALHYER
jgi:hypothetical protein